VAVAARGAEGKVKTKKKERNKRKSPSGGVQRKEEVLKKIFLVFS
jgi:hypothetical protein